MDNRLSETQTKFLFRRSTIVKAEKQIECKSIESRAIHIAGCSNLLPGKLRFRLLTLNSEIYNQGKDDLENIINDKRNEIQGKIKMYEELNEKYTSDPVSQFLFIKSIVLKLLKNLLSLLAWRKMD